MVQPPMYLFLKCLNLPYSELNIIESYRMYSSMTCLFGSNYVFEISLGLWFIHFQCCIKFPFVNIYYFSDVHFVVPSFF